MKCGYCDDPDCPYEQNYYCKNIRNFARRLEAMKKKFRNRSGEGRKRFQLSRHLDNIMDPDDDSKLKVKPFEAQVTALERRPSNKGEGPKDSSLET